MASNDNLPSPSEIADDRSYSPEAAHGNVHGQDNGHGQSQSDSNQPLPSPSEIADDNQPYSPAQEQGHEHGREQEQQHGR